MSEGGTYRDPCPKCGARLIGFSKQDYVEHLRENGETLAAKIEEKLVVDETQLCRRNCADATAPSSADTNHQEER